SKAFDGAFAKPVIDVVTAGPPMRTSATDMDAQTSTWAFWPSADPAFAAPHPSARERSVRLKRRQRVLTPGRCVLAGPWLSRVAVSRPRNAGPVDLVQRDPLAAPDPQ